MAITTPETRSKPSIRVHLRVKAIFAETGPMTHKVKAEKEPKKAIIELKSGIRIDTKTDEVAKQDRSRKTRSFLMKGL